MKRDFKTLRKRERKMAASLTVSNESRQMTGQRLGRDEVQTLFGKTALSEGEEGKCSLHLGRAR